MGRRFLDRGDYYAAFDAFKRASRLAGDNEDREFAHGLAHLAAAAHRRRLGDDAAAARQLAHARRRLASTSAGPGRTDADSMLTQVERYLHGIERPDPSP